MKAVRPLVVVALVAGIAGVAGARPLPPRHLPKLGPTKVVGGTSLQRRTMKAVVRAFGPSTVTRIRIAPSPNRRWSLRSRIDLQMWKRPTLTFRAQWDRWMLASGFVRRLVALGRRGPVSILVADGRQEEIVRARLSYAPDAHPLSRRARAALGRRLRRSVERSGAVHAMIRIRRPYGAVAIIVVGARRPASFIKYRLRTVLDAVAVRRSPDLEGSYVGVVDARGRLVFEWANSTRVQGGGFWIRPDLESCSPVESTGYFGAQPPPCPA